VQEHLRAGINMEMFFRTALSFLDNIGAGFQNVLYFVIGKAILRN
jgi:hypothetical protein